MDELTVDGRGRYDDPSYDAALSVTCPICEARANERCRPRSLTAPHEARVELAREAGR